MLEARIERGSMILALGGGVIGDLAGFAASILLRGIEFIQIPTTLLAQVDSSVGGKTGINTAQGKNLVGSFHQPRMVLADIDALESLPRRELLAGYAEVVKYGLINDPAFFSWLETHGADLIDGDPAARRHAVMTSCAAKAAIVAADEREADQRALLNLGHTFGHALEAECGYSGELLHGEAVAIGMVMAFELSAMLGFCPSEDPARVARHLASVGLPTSPAAIGRGFDASRLVHHMRQDKKVKDGRLTFVLARGIGRAFLSREVEPAQLDALLARALAA
jgi:3-dehydroquinate synthase